LRPAAGRFVVRFLRVSVGRAEQNELAVNLLKGESRALRPLA